MEVRCIAGQNDHRTGRIGLQLFSIELITQPDIEDAGNDRVDRSSGCVWGISFKPWGTFTLTM